MSYDKFFEPLFLFWGSPILAWIISLLVPVLVLFTLIRLIFGGVFNV